MFIVYQLISYIYYRVYRVCEFMTIQIQFLEENKTKVLNNNKSCIYLGCLTHTAFVWMSKYFLFKVPLQHVWYPYKDPDMPLCQ